MENRVLQILNTANTKYKSYYPWTIFVREKITSLSVHKCVCVCVCVRACLFVKWLWLKLHLKSISWSDILTDYAHTGLWQQQQDVLTSTSVIVSCRRHFEDQITVTIRVAALSWHYQTLITKCLLSLLKKGGRASPKLVYYTDLQEVREYTSTGLILSQHCHTDAGKIHGRTDHILSYHTYRDVHGRNWLIVSTVRRRILLNEKGWGESIPGDTDRV